MREIKRTLGIADTKPPIGASTRWAGIIPMITWVNENMEALIEYDAKHPRDCAVLEDGSTYKDYVLREEDYELLNQLLSDCYRFIVVIIWLNNACAG